VIVTVALVAMAAVLFALAVAKLASVIKGGLALRRAPRGASQDFDSVLLKSVMVPGVSVVYVAPDATALVRAHVRRLLDLHYGTFEILLVVDGVAAWTDELRLEREERTAVEPLPGARIRGYYVSRDPIQLLVLDVEAEDPGKAWHAGVKAAKHAMIGVVDREAEFIPELLLRLIRPMLQDERMLAVCGLAPGSVHPGLMGQFSALRALCTWLENCGQFGGQGKLALLPGASLLVKREAIQAVHGFGWESRELVLDIPAQGQVGLVPMAVSWRRAAADWAEMRQQFARDPSQSAAVLPSIVETTAYILAAAGLISGAIRWPVAALLLLVTAGMGMLTSMAVVILREMAEPSGLAPVEVAALFLSAIPENLGYRQVRHLYLCARSLRGQSGSRPVH